jgi:hypothetical protein
MANVAHTAQIGKAGYRGFTPPLLHRRSDVKIEDGRQRIVRQGHLPERQVRAMDEAFDAAFEALDDMVQSKMCSKSSLNELSKRQARGHNAAEPYGGSPVMPQSSRRSPPHACSKAYSAYLMIAMVKSSRPRTGRILLA